VPSGAFFLVTATERAFPPFCLTLYSSDLPHTGEFSALVIATDRLSAGNFHLWSELQVQESGVGPSAVLWQTGSGGLSFPETIRSSAKQRVQRGSYAFRCCLVSIHNRHHLPISVIPLLDRLIFLLLARYVPNVAKRSICMRTV